MSATTTTRRKRVPDERILDAASVEFARAGYDAAALDRVASAAGTSRVTLYTRFESKMTLFKAVIDREADELERRLLDAYAMDERTPLRARLHAYVAAYFEFSRDRPAGFRILFLNEFGLASTVERLTTRIAELFAHGDGRDAPTAEDRFVASLIIGAVHHGAGVAAASGQVDPAVAAMLTERFLARGVRMTLSLR